MATIQFPTDGLSDGYTFVADNGVIYTYDSSGGGGWTANNPDYAFVSKSGDTMTGDLTVPSLNGGQLAGFRNQIINGQFVINQRDNNSLSNPGEFCPDRWYNAGTEILGLNRPTPGSYIGCGLSPVSGTGIVRQAIELPKPNSLGGNVPFPVSPFQPGSVWTLSLYADGSDPSLANNTLQYADNVGGNNPQDAATGAGWVSEGNNRWSNTYTFNGSVPAENHNCLLVQLQWSDARIGGVQLEPGLVCTPFENRPIQTELALCQRYYAQGSMGISTHVGADGFMATRIAYPVEMRVNATTTWTTTWTWGDGVPSWNGIVNGNGTDTLGLIIYGGASTNSSVTAAGDWTADAEL